MNKQILHDLKIPHCAILECDACELPCRIDYESDTNKRCYYQDDPYCCTIPSLLGEYPGIEEFFKKVYENAKVIYNEPNRM